MVTKHFPDTRPSSCSSGLRAAHGRVTVCLSGMPCESVIVSDQAKEQNGRRLLRPAAAACAANAAVNVTEGAAS